MLYLLLGSDDFSKKVYVESLSEQKKIPVDFLPDNLDFIALKNMLVPSLFAPEKIFVISGQVSSLSEDEVGELKRSSQQIILVESKLDKRKTQTQKLLKDKEIFVKEFAVPAGKDLEKWLIARAKELKGSIEAGAAVMMVARLAGEETGGFGKEEKNFDLHQADNELKKLLTFTQNQVITKEVVENLVADTAEAESWDIVNAFADKNIKKAYSLMDRFFKTAAGSDEKSKVIQLNASLAEQFRSILMIQSFENSSLSEQAILSRTGWKSGRLYIVKKLARKFETQKIKDFCSKLASLDEQLKSTSTPPRVLLDLITSQIII